jgi:hypothetical protein
MVAADRFYRTFVPGKFFSKGWGCLETLERLLKLHINSLKNKNDVYKRISSGYEVKIDEVSSGWDVTTPYPGYFNEGFLGVVRVKERTTWKS